MSTKNLLYTLSRLSRETGIARETWRNYLHGEGSQFIIWKSINPKMKKFEILVTFNELLENYLEYRKRLHIEKSRKGAIKLNLMLKNKKKLDK